MVIARSKLSNEKADNIQIKLVQIEPFQFLPVGCLKLTIVFSIGSKRGSLSDL